MNLVLVLATNACKKINIYLYPSRRVTNACFALCVVLHLSDVRVVMDFYQILKYTPLCVNASILQ